MREAGLDSDDIEVINPITGSTEYISKDDPSYYDASGFKGRRYKGSSKPKDIPTFLWRGASKAARERAKREALLKEATEKHDAAVAKERKYNRVIDRFATSAVAESKDVNHSDDFIPAMPVISNPGRSHGGNHCHRDKLKDQSELMYFHFSNALVARPVGQKEINNTPAAQAALDKEWNNLTSKGAWDYSTVREWDDVSREAIKNKTKVPVGKIFEICVEKGSELPQGDPMRKFKGRTVFQGNHVKDEAADVALFAELGSSPANMEAGKALDAYGLMPGNRTSQGDGKQAYTQALMQGILTWIRLPRNRWPKEWTECTKIRLFFLYWHYMVTPIRGVSGNVIVRRHYMQSDFILSIPSVGRPCFGIPNWSCYLVCMLMTSRCQDLQRTLMKVGNLFLPRSTWILLKMQVDTLDANMFSNKM